MRQEHFYLAMMAAVFTACSSDIDLVSTTQNVETKENAISFQVVNRNSVRGSESKLLNDAGHYNFGVFAYKNSENASSLVMSNYLVGYGGENDTHGYSLNAASQTTIANSRWAYEKLGSLDYIYDGTEGYYKKSDLFYMSNNQNQYLKYWDLSTASVDFYAYAPYLNGSNTATFDHNTSTLAFPLITDGYDDPSRYDYLYANKNVTKKDYDNKVQIDFKRISAKVRIGFYETIDGYSVKILNLKQETGTDAVGVSAAPAKQKTGGTYEYGTFYHTGKASVAFGQSPSLTLTGQEKYAKNSDYSYLNFKVPTDEAIGTTFQTASMSATEYYLIPDNETNKTGLTFHVTYQLKALDTDETIIVHNATVHVPYQKDEATKYCDWKNNYVYKYIFRITKGSSGSTDNPDNIDPSDPTPGTVDALKPIIFDGCTVEDWQSTSSEHDIN